ncbi:MULTISPECIES: hypothetical protein [Pseudomonas]|uniref:hypothetical protein n=1 Tax=Pseudomonas TaxID=286 RepID=UPI001E28DB0F|nr:MULTISPECIES: hypothetical protein [Pseudomonas]MCE1117247.1 hypothetical protein [Pseudomonas sp. NMI795_08]
MTEAGGNYSGADLRLRKGDDSIDSAGRQVYVNVKMKTASNLQATSDPVGAGLPAKAIIQAMTVTLLTHSRASPLPQGR